MWELEFELRSFRFLRSLLYPSFGGEDLGGSYPNLNIQLLGPYLNVVSCSCLEARPLEEGTRLHPTHLHPFIFWGVWASLTWQDSASCLVGTRTVCAWHGLLPPWNICGSLLLWVILFSTHLQLVRKQGSYLLVDVCNLKKAEILPKWWLSWFTPGESLWHINTHTHMHTTLSGEDWAGTWSVGVVTVHWGPSSSWWQLLNRKAFHTAMVVFPDRSCCQMSSGSPNSLKCQYQRDVLCHPREWEAEINSITPADLGLCSEERASPLNVS